MAKKQQTPQPEQTEGTELALFPKLNLPAVTQITEEMRASFGTMFTRIEEEIADLPRDMSDPKNRDIVRSVAFKIARTKTGLDEAAAHVASDAKQIVDSVNAERRTLRDTLDELKEKARAPLTAWEEAERLKGERAKEEIARFQNVTVDHGGKDSGELTMILDDLKAWQFKEEHYGERAEDVKAAHVIAVERIKEMLAVQSKYEAEQAELEQLRREKAEREEADRIRREKEEAERRAEEERKRQEGERARIEQEAKERAAREAEEKIAAERREREAAEQRAKEAEEREKQRIEDEKRRAIEAEEARKEAAARAEEEARRREEQAKQEERDRIERERLRQEQADRERAADLAHRKKLNGEAVAGLMAACGLSEKDAQAVVIAIYKGQVAHVAINY